MMINRKMLISACHRQIRTEISSIHGRLTSLERFCSDLSKWIRAEDQSPMPELTDIQDAMAAVMGAEKAVSDIKTLLLYMHAMVTSPVGLWIRKKNGMYLCSLCGYESDHPEEVCMNCGSTMNNEEDTHE